MLVYGQMDLKQLMVRVVLNHSSLSGESEAHLVTASQLALSISSLCLHHAGIRWVPLLTLKLSGFWGCKLWFSHQCFIHRPIPQASPAFVGFFFVCVCLFGLVEIGLAVVTGFEFVILLLLTLRC